VSTHKTKRTAKEVAELVQKIHGSILIMDVSSYLGMKHKAKFTDSEYGEHWMLPYTVIKGGGHPKRGAVKATNSKNFSRIIVENDKRFMVCNHCSIKKEELLFHFNPSRKTYDRSCLECWSKQKKENRIKNFETEKASKEKYVKNNPEKVLETKRKWKERNIGKVKADRAMAKERIRQATLPGLTKESLRLIEYIYEESERKTKETGIPHEVDHFIPLRGKDVCGLHVPWNLRVITADENRAKSNKIILMENSNYE
jgi:hypothetical protein